MCICAHAWVNSISERLGFPDEKGGDIDNKVPGRVRNKRENEKQVIPAFHSLLNGFPLNLQGNAFLICYGGGFCVAKMFPQDGLAS